MATNANWTIVFEDKIIIKNFAEGANEGIGYIVSDDSFWNDSKFSNIWAIQYGTSTPTDEVEHKDGTPHCSYAEADLGDISQFSSRWDAAHLTKLQADWDADERDESEKGSRPTSYSS
jgi:hypothetical protein|tara:strand:- start:4531 stop:4884 length:354 start_codon:yes stop_codon:yes gene_type:complete